MAIQSSKVHVLQKTNNAFNKDTIFNYGDTLVIDVSGAQTIELPSKPIEVKTQDKETFEYVVDIITIIGVIIAAVYTLSSFKKLFKRDEQKDEQIRELSAQTAQIIRQNELYEKRIRMLVKPRLWTNGGGYSGHDGEVNITINNRGHLCFIDSWTPFDSEDVVFIEWKDPIEIDNGGRTILRGQALHKHPKDIYFKLKVIYRDQEENTYESIFDWRSGSTSLISTKEL